MMVSNYVGIRWEISEIEFDQSSGHAVHTYATGELVPMYFAPNLSPDGLRMYYVDSNGPMAYYDRADLATNFTSPRQVPSAPRVAESFMTSKCARLYVYSQDLDTLFWVQQL